MEEKKNTGFHTFNSAGKSSGGKIVIAFILIVILGIGTGFILSKSKETVPLAGVSSGTGNTTAMQGKTFGSTDLKTFKDSATGVLQLGGMDGEGAYHLVRPGGDSQNVYLTSSIVDLSQFIGKKIIVHGQTQSSTKVGWLMDVGQVEVQ